MTAIAHQIPPILIIKETLGLGAEGTDGGDGGDGGVEY